MRHLAAGVCLALIASCALAQGSATPADSAAAAPSGRESPLVQSGAHNVRGLAYKHSGQLKLALEEYDAALALDPDNAEALDNRGVVYDLQGRYARAIADFDRAITLSPGDSAAYYNRGNAYANMGRTDKAVADFRRALKIDPSMGLAREALKDMRAQP